MDAITSALQAIQPAVQPAAEIAGVGSAAYNLYNQYQNQQYQDTLRQDAQNPAKVTALAQQYTQPLNAGLTTSVNNQAQAYLAQRGLSDSPQISQQVESQALAPYIQQNGQQGYADAIQALGLGGGAVNPNNQAPNSIAALAKMFAGQQSNPGALNGASALTRLLQLAQPGSNVMPQTQAPDLGDQSIPYQPTQSLDLSSFYVPDYSASGSGGDSVPYTGSD
jgi:hypothetical protein